MERLNESIKELLSELVLNRLKDPRVGLVTITAVDVAKDMDSAKVFFTVLGDENQRKDSKKGLESAKAFLRATVARELKLRTMPELRFVYDDSLDRSMRIEDTLKKIHDDEKKVS
jgi:ribosome-binding factor A